MQLQTVKSEVQKHHDRTDCLAMRWGMVHGNIVEGENGGCFAGFISTLDHAKYIKSPYIYVIFHGDGARLSFDGLKDQAVFNQEMIQHTQPWNKFIGTERTLTWIRFLLSNESPWKALHPFIAEQSPEYCNNAGFIFHSIPNIPAKLLYNFVMGLRFPWEMAQQFGTWLELTKILDPAISLYIANNFCLRKEAKNIQGPYDIFYPWSPLEETCFEAAGRFILQTPGTLRTDERPSNPNVHPLWCIQNDEARIHALNTYNTLEKDPNLALNKIVNALTECVNVQKAVF